MEPLSTGLTWEEVVNRFAEDGEYTLLLNQRNRRAKKGDRHNPDPEAERKTVWRLVLQRQRKTNLETVLRKNIKDVEGSILSEKAGDKIINTINQLIS